MSLCVCLVVLCVVVSLVGVAVFLMFVEFVSLSGCSL